MTGVQTCALPISIPFLFTEDVNKNGIVDTGSLLEHRQPEQVKFLKMNDKPMIDILPRTEVEQDLDLSELFRPKTAAE